MLFALVPSQSQVISQRLSDALAAIPDGPAKSAGIALGMQAAQAILERRQGDGADTPGPPLPSNPANPDDPYVSTTLPGDYRFDTTPNFGFALYPSWGLVTPFVIDVAAHALPGPDPLASFAYAADFGYCKAIGGAVSSLRTAEQERIAHFWFEASPIGWNRIANNAIVAHRLDAWRAARVLALLNFAMADGFIAGWDRKYLHRFWRPETAIREADSDGNPFTRPDPDWVAFLSSPTPPFFTPPLPDYPSTHTVLGAAAAEVLIAFFGDRFGFTATSTTLPGVEPALPGILGRRDRKRAFARLRGHSLRSRSDRRLPPGSGHRTGRGEAVEETRPVKSGPGDALAPSVTPPARAIGRWPVAGAYGREAGRRWPDHYASRVARRPSCRRSTPRHLAPTADRRTLRQGHRSDCSI